MKRILYAICAPVGAVLWFIADALDIIGPDGLPLLERPTIINQ